MTNLVTPAFADNGNYEREPILDEAVRTAVNTGTAFLTPFAICVVADGLAATIFPPAVALAPSCAAFAAPTAVVGGAAAAYKGVEKLATAH